MDEDLHLVVAALAADRVVVSLDNQVRGYFSKQASCKDLIWINPAEELDKALEWLYDPHDPQRFGPWQLKNYEPG